MKMCLPPTEDYILYQGDKYQVEFYYGQNGKMPAKEYFDQLSERVQAKLIALIIRIAETGKIYDKTKYNIEDKVLKIFAFKPFSDRFFNFFTKDQRIILTNAYRKQKQKVNKDALNKAIDLKKDYMRRTQEEKYYGTGKNKNIR